MRILSQEGTMNILKQTKSTNCGQTCVAMLLGITIPEAEKLFGHGGVTTQEEVLAILDSKFPDCWQRDFDGAIKYKNRNKHRTYLCLHRNPDNFEQAHWTICFDGVIIDPAQRDPLKLWPMWRHWVL